MGSRMKVWIMKDEDLEDLKQCLRKKILDLRRFKESKTSGWITCPNCGAEHKLSDAVDKATGICSDKCWNEFIGGKG